MTDTTIGLGGRVAALKAASDEAIAALEKRDDARQVAERAEQHRLDCAEALGRELAAAVGDAPPVLSALLDGFLGHTTDDGASDRARALMKAAIDASGRGYGCTVEGLLKARVSA